MWRCVWLDGFSKLAVRAMKWVADNLAFVQAQTFDLTEKNKDRMFLFAFRKLRLIVERAPA